MLEGLAQSLQQKLPVDVEGQKLRDAMQTYHQKVRHVDEAPFAFDDGVEMLQNLGHFCQLGMRSIPHV